jgi:hypothetical protein
LKIPKLLAEANQVQEVKSSAEAGQQLNMFEV